jgi:hypothetical protein
VASVCNGVVGTFCPITTFSTLQDGLCPPPLNIVVSNISSSGAKATWDSMPGVMSWRVLVHPFNFPSMNYQTVYTKSYNVGALQPNTTYNVVVMANCPSAMLSGATSYIFQTPAQICQDANEPNNTIAQATTLAAGSTKSGGISNFTDLDYFKIAVTTNAPNLKVKLSNLPKDYDLKVFNSAGAMLRLSEKADTISEIITLNNLPAGNYYAQVFGFSGSLSASNCYSISATTSSVAYLGAGNTPGTIALTQASSVVTANEAEIESAEIIADKVDAQKTKDFDFKISPNPLQDEANIDFGSNFKGEIKISILDMSGRIVSNDALYVDSNSGNVLYNMSQLQNGMYIMVAQNQNIKKTFKVVVNK